MNTYQGPLYKIKSPILGITGHKGHGKDTIAALLQQRFLWTRMAFADELKRIAKDLWGLSEAQVNGSLADKETVDPTWGVSPRHLLQTLGTEAGRSAHPETWIRRLFRTMEAWEAADENEGLGDLRVGYVISDVRFPNEADAIRKHGGTIWRVNRPGFSTGSLEAHASETSIEAIFPDRILLNQTLDGLASQTEAMLALPAYGKTL